MRGSARSSPRVHAAHDPSDRRTRASACAALLDDVKDGVPFDFVHEFAAELPMQMICQLLGVPEEDRHWLFAAVEPGFDYKGSRRSFEPDLDALAALSAHERLRHGADREEAPQPADDMLSIVVAAELDDVDPPRLTDEELYGFFSLLFSAGSETTRNAVAGGLLALIERPDQLARLRGDLSLLSTAIEEIIRWTTPSPSKRRTATRAASCAARDRRRATRW
jgi:cytochrome P450